jgi:predicted SAM-dependent methyltransferase
MTVTRKLHVGGTVRAAGWEVLNITAGPHVDHVGNANDLSRFGDGSFAAVYASHTLEHFDYAGELEKTLKEWARVLVPGGSLYVSVPDLETLAKLLLVKEGLNMDERFHVMRMLFGGHIDAHDYHLVGLNEEFLAYFLMRTGFAEPRRVPSFGLFQDTSGLLFKEIPISLNMVAIKPASAQVQP